MHYLNPSRIKRMAFSMISQFNRFFEFISGMFLLFGPAVWRHLSQFEERRMLCYSVLQSVSVGNNVRKSTSVVIFFHEFFRVTHIKSVNRTEC